MTRLLDIINAKNDSRRASNRTDLGRIRGNPGLISTNPGSSQIRW
jgi:hypothetical protein